MSIRGKRYLDKKYGKMTISKFMRSYRLTEGLSQSQIADILGWSTGNICDIENGRRHVGIERAIVISEKLGFPLPYILEIIFNEQIQNAGLDLSVKLISEKEKKAA